MKKILYTFIIPLLLLPVFTSCESESTGEPEITAQTRAIGVEIATDGKSQEQINCARFIVFDNASELPKLDINEFIPEEEIKGISSESTGLKVSLKVSNHKDKVIFVILNEPKELLATLEGVSSPEELENIELTLNHFMQSNHHTLKPAGNGVPMTGVKWAGSMHGHPVSETEEAAKANPLKITVERSVARVAIYLKADEGVDAVISKDATVTLRKTFARGRLAAGTEADGTRYTNTYKDFGFMQTVSANAIKTWTCTTETAILQTNDKDQADMVCYFYTPERTCKAANDQDKLEIEIAGIMRNGLELPAKTVQLISMVPEGEEFARELEVIRRNNSYNIVGTIGDVDKIIFSPITVEPWNEEPDYPVEL